MASEGSKYLNSAASIFRNEFHEKFKEHCSHEEIQQYIKFLGMYKKNSDATVEGMTTQQQSNIQRLGDLLNSFPARAKELHDELSEAEKRQYKSPIPSVAEIMQNRTSSVGRNAAQGRKPANDKSIMMEVEDSEDEDPMSDQNEIREENLDGDQIEYEQQDYDNDHSEYEAEDSHGGHSRYEEDDLDADHKAYGEENRVNDQNENESEAGTLDAQDHAEVAEASSSVPTIRLYTGEQLKRKFSPCPWESETIQILSAKGYELVPTTLLRLWKKGGGFVKEVENVQGVIRKENAYYRFFVDDPESLKLLNGKKEWKLVKLRVTETVRGEGDDKETIYRGVYTTGGKR